MKASIVVNPVDCIGCRTCEAACALANLPATEVKTCVSLPRLKVRRLNPASAANPV
ncbi:effector protein [Citrobacter sp. S2-9]|uniref:Effector protein n=1 Tax=Citrobacter enshiensis TaxID=2971264 RepID=A0ABT8PVL3_9ENTR|nr:effector protein [Citrobacter enshiensis]MDN8600406.1 effector protein [Citrobacter enshiensis]